jgi:hypothetical protein
MSFWKILGGAVLGVGAVAAAPFTGGGSILGAATLASSLAGAGTIAAAVGAGAVGAAIGASLGDEDEARDQGYRQGKMEAKAETLKDIERLTASLNTALGKLRESTKCFNAIYAMEAVAVACANCDGEICAEEREQIEMFISGISRGTLPESVMVRIREIYEHPLNIKEAFQLAKNAEVEMEVFDSIINLVMHADGVVHQKEQAFVQAWNILKAA